MMVMAGGTGGHVFPALAVAQELRERGLEIFWLGTPGGFETRVVAEHGFPMELIAIRGLRGNGLAGWLAAPFRIGRAMWQVLQVLRRRRPRLVLGMGGFVTGPGGLMARLLGIPLVIHEQNALPGMTNQWLARVATRVLAAFPDSFSPSRRARVVGNPVRPEIAALAAPEQRLSGRSGPLRILVLGGSQGAQALNESLPLALALIDPEMRPQVRHQAGRNKLASTQAAYEAAGVDALVEPFVADMAAAYGWADLVICRAGALTIAELAAVGVASILVPYPHAVDDHQTRNAAYLVDGDAALLLPQSSLSAETLSGLLRTLLADRQRLLQMAQAARRLGLPEATRKVADLCEEVLA